MDWPICGYVKFLKYVHCLGCERVRVLGLVGTAIRLKIARVPILKNIHKESYL